MLLYRPDGNFHFNSLQKSICCGGGCVWKSRGEYGKKTDYQITTKIFDAEYTLPKLITGNIFQPFPQEMYSLNSDLISEDSASVVGGVRSVG